MEHEVKTWVQFKHDVLSQNKNFEVRKDDRNYEVGDILIQRFWNPETKQYDGDSMYARISYKLNGGQFGIEQGFCVLGLDMMQPYFNHQ